MVNRATSGPRDGDFSFEPTGRLDVYQVTGGDHRFTKIVLVRPSRLTPLLT